ncbi:hypothetical protein CEXT_184871 [Caerostris extrusa]|uniref:Eukaryotic translation initiation factor 3 subunit A n=1 Tax=Caerostris extrusa TaxID=172846 RepID=A0AAV4QQ69_CAEEX|nr:hypothetical protein CEXT_184871 [Caerostris extrusa]
MRQRQIEEEMKREREEALAKLQEIEAKKRAKEKEIEERLIREEAAALERKREEEKTLNRAKEAEKPNLSWKERELEKRQRLPREEKDQDFSRNLDDRDRSDAWKRKVDRPKEMEGSWRREEPPTSRRGERFERDRIPWGEKDREYSRKPNDNDRPDAWRRKADRPQERGGSWRREDPPTSRSEQPERDNLSREENDREYSRKPNDNDRPDAWRRKADRPQEGGGSWRREDPPTSRSERPERDNLSREENDREYSRKPNDNDRPDAWRRKADRLQEGGGSRRREDPPTSRSERPERDRLSREENDRGSSRNPDDHDRSNGWRRKTDRPQEGGGSWRREDPSTSRRGERTGRDGDYSRKPDDRDQSDGWRKVDRPQRGSWRREDPPTSRR